MSNGPRLRKVWRDKVKEKQLAISQLLHRLNSEQKNESMEYESIRLRFVSAKFAYHKNMTQRSKVIAIVN